MNTTSTRHPFEQAIRDSITVAAWVKGGNGWGRRHALAMQAPKGVERGHVTLFRALAVMAEEHAIRFEGPISEDGYAAPAWLEIWRQARHLLSMEMGRLDGGSLDSLLFVLGKLAGFSDEELGA